MDAVPFIKMNDEQYETKHKIPPTKKARELAESEVTPAIDAVMRSAQILITVSNDRLKHSNDGAFITVEKSALDSYLAACYSLFFVHAKLIKLCSLQTVAKIDYISSVLCKKATARLHPINLL